MFGGMKYMFSSAFRFVKHSATDGAKLFKKQNEDPGTQDEPVVADDKTIVRNMVISRAVFGFLFLLCVLGVVAYTENSAIAGGHFLLLVVFFGFKFLQVNKDLTNFTEGKSNGRTEKR